VFTSTGTFSAIWATAEGSGPVDLEGPEGIALDSQGQYIYITDTNNHRVEKFAADGSYLSQLGGPGVGDGQFVLPYGIVVGSDGSVYVSDYDQSHICIQKFSAAGTFVLKFGSFGTSGDGKLNGPFALARDKYDNIYVSDGNNQVQVFRSDGTFLARWGSAGSGQGDFNQPAGIGLDSSGDIYVVDNGNNRVEAFSPGATPAAGSSWGRVKSRYRE
jgi:tripartite motif-containing protein 71